MQVLLCKRDVRTCANSSTEMTRFPSLSKHSNAVLAIFSHPSRASSWYVLTAATQNSSKSNFLCESGSIFKQKHKKLWEHAIMQKPQQMKHISFFLNSIRSCNSGVSANRQASNGTSKERFHDEISLGTLVQIRCFLYSFIVSLNITFIETDCPPLFDLYPHIFSGVQFNMKYTIHESEMGYVH